MPDDPNPDRLSRLCWASVDLDIPCNDPATSPVGLCRQHHALYRLHPSHLPAVAVPDRSSWLDRAVNNQRTA